MEKKTNNKLLIVAVVAAVGICLLGFVILLAMGTFALVWPSRSASSTATQIPPAEPAVDLVGIWQQNNSMAAGWAERYHFYPSGSFHFYPSEMACVAQKVEKIGTWRLEGVVLTLSTTRQIIQTLEVYDNGLCSLVGKEEALLSEPAVELIAVEDLGIADGDFYPSIRLDGEQYWKFSDDAARYGDEEWPE